MDESLLRNEENVLRNSDDNNSKLKTCGGLCSLTYKYRSQNLLNWLMLLISVCIYEI